MHFLGILFPFYIFNFSVRRERVSKREKETVEARRGREGMEIERERE